MTYLHTVHLRRTETVKRITFYKCLAPTQHDDAQVLYKLRVPVSQIIQDKKVQAMFSNLHASQTRVTVDLKMVIGLQIGDSDIL